MATRYSLPTWLVRQWRESFDGRLEEVCTAVNAPAQTAIVVNALRLTIDEAEAQLASAGVETRRSPFVTEALLVRQRPCLGGDGRGPLVAAVGELGDGRRRAQSAAR